MALIDKTVIPSLLVICGAFYHLFIMRRLTLSFDFAGGAAAARYYNATTMQASSNHTPTKFEEMFVVAYDKSLGRGDKPQARTNEPRRVYNISEFPPEYRTAGGLMDDDRELLGNIYSTANSSFEYGLGESTYIAAWTRMPRWSGIDSDSNWVVGVRDKPLIPSYYQFNFGDIGPTKVWGYPTQPDLDKMLFRYVVAPLALEREPFDVYLVDGRWRVACACMAFLHAMSLGGDMDKIRVLVHDYQDTNRGYTIIEDEIADVDRRSSKLRVFKLKPGIGESEVADLFLRNVDNYKR